MLYPKYLYYQGQLNPTGGYPINITRELEYVCPAHVADYHWFYHPHSDARFLFPRELLTDNYDEAYTDNRNGPFV